MLYDYSAVYFKRATEIEPDYDFGHNNLGVYYARRDKPGDMERAEKCFRAALRVNPNYPDAFNNLAIVLTKQGKLDEAIVAHKAGISRRVSERASDHNNLCRVYMQKGDFDNALAEDSIALKCDRNFLPAWTSRVEIYLKQENLAEATKCVQVMIGKDVKSSETINALWRFASKALELNRGDDAIVLYDQYLNAKGAMPEAYAYRARVYGQKGDPQRAKQDFETLLHSAQNIPEFRSRSTPSKNSWTNPPRGRNERKAT